MTRTHQKLIALLRAPRALLHKQFSERASLLSMLDQANIRPYRI